MSDYRNVNNPIGDIHLSDEQLLAQELTIGEPEGLPDICTDMPPDGDAPIIEFDYDVSERGYKATCVYCRHPNHFHGVVAKFPNGRRYLIGRDCAENKHGHIYIDSLEKFDKSKRRRDSLVRRQYFREIEYEIYSELETIRRHPSVQLYDRACSSWRSFNPLAINVARIARAEHNLVTEREVPDEARERQRKRELGDMFEEEKARAKSNGEPWRIHKIETIDRGPISERSFYLNTIIIKDEINKIIDDILKIIRIICDNENSANQHNRNLQKLYIDKKRLIDIFDKVDSLKSAIGNGQIQRICEYANDQYKSINGIISDKEIYNVYRILNGEFRYQNSSFPFLLFLERHKPLPRRIFELLK